MTISDLYIQLFGKGHIKDGSVIDMAEHGRAGGVSTGSGYKNIKNVEETTLIDSDGDITYIGKALVGSGTGSLVWQIKKILTSGTITTIGYANGTTSYDKEWDERASYSYS
jgi:hypothetical protein